MKRLIKNVMQRRCQGLVPRSRTDEGFTLVEVMVAVAVVTMGIVAVLGLIPVGLKSARDAADNTQAAMIAQDAFSYTRRQALAAWSSLGGINEYYDAAGVNTTTSADYYFHLVTTLTTLSSPTRVLVVSTVTWPANALSPANQSSSTNITEIAQYQ